MPFYWLVVGVVAVWRITHLLQVEDGPWDLVVRLRRLAGYGFWGKLLDCFYCLSLWVAFPVAWELGESGRRLVLLWLGLSGGAILLERLTGSRIEEGAAAYYEEPPNQGGEHGLLRAESAIAPNDDIRPE